jgi:hypothetical protein
VTEATIDATEFWQAMVFLRPRISITYSHDNVFLISILALVEYRSDGKDTQIGPYMEGNVYVAGEMAIKIASQVA